MCIFKMHCIRALRGNPDHSLYTTHWICTNLTVVPSVGTGGPPPSTAIVGLTAYDLSNDVFADDLESLLKVIHRWETF